MRTKFLLVVSLLGVCCPGQTLASQDAASETEAENDGDRVRRLIRQFEVHLYAKRYPEALAVIETIEIDQTNRLAVAYLSGLRASALFGLKRDKEGHAELATIERLAPQDTAIWQTVFIGGLVSARVDVSGPVLDKMIDRFPDEVRKIDWEVMRVFLAQQRDAKDPRKDDRAVSLGQIGYGGASGDYMTAQAVDILLERGDSRGASDLLRYIDDPEVIEGLLIQKKYAALWPAIESSMGDNLHRARMSSVAAAELEHRAEPGNAEKLKNLANALRFSGRTEDALALQKHVPASAAAWKAAEEDTGWLVNEIALALHGAGRAEEADRLFERLLGAEIDNSRWRINMHINRLELLVADGQFDRALPLVGPTEKAAAVDGSDYARQLVRRLKYCTLSGLGRKAEAAAMLPDVMAHAKDARSATIDGLLCAGEIERAEELALTSLKDKSFEPSFVHSLQQHPLTGSDPSVWSKGWLQLRARPAIAKEFDRLGRDLPERFRLRRASGGAA